MSKASLAAGSAIALALLGVLTWELVQWAPLRVPVSARSGDAKKETGGERPERGDYRGDLAFLREHWQAPTLPGESNHYIDLWNPGEMVRLARANGLTNNHTLFVDSHSKAGLSIRGSGFGFYPRASLVRPGVKTPYYSVRDLASILGSENAASIHNVVLAGCNEEGRFRSAEVRRHFLNATNIVYMEPGQLAFKPMFYQAVVYRSDEIKPLYGKPRRVSADRVECVIVGEPRRGLRPLGVYLADLYLPGAAKPFLTRKAGRELIAPEVVTKFAAMREASAEDERRME